MTGRGNGQSHGSAMANGPKTPASWLITEMQQLLKSTFWEMT